MKKTTLPILALSLFTGLFFSCNKKTAAEKAFKPCLATDTKCQINIAGNYKNFEALEAEFDRFNEFYPDVELNFSFLDSYNSTIKSALAGESAPDIYMTFQWMLDRPEYKELFASAQDMSDEKALGFNLSTIRSELIEHTADGRTPMVPVLSGSYGMMVNEDIFKKEGIELPQTYSALVTACNKLKAAGYKSPIMVYADNFMGLPLIYSYFCKSLENNPDAVAMLNQLTPEAGQYLKPALEWAQRFMEEELIDLDQCRTIKDKYNEVIMTFFEGNIPIMLCDTDIVSGTLKREAQSQAFVNNPFKYSFRIFPATDQNSYFVNNVSVGFSVNKNSKNLDMADEFMRFLVRTEELNNLAKIKRLITVSKDYSFDEVFAPLSKSTPIYLGELGLIDSAISQMRTAVQQVLIGNMTVEQAADNYGSFK